MFRYFVGFALQYEHTYRNMRVRLALVSVVAVVKLQAVDAPTCLSQTRELYYKRRYKNGLMSHV